VSYRLAIKALPLLFGTLTFALGQPAGQKPEQPRPAPAATLVISGIGKGLAPIDGLWQFHLGDDLSWARPEFNDSGWETISAEEPWGAQGHPSYAGFGWYRRHLDILPAAGTTAEYRVEIPEADDAYEVYWNGSPVGQYGKLPPHASWYYNPFPRSFPLTGSTSGVLAIRVWKAPLDAFSSAESGGLSGQPQVGDPTTISLHEDSNTWDMVRIHLFDYSLILLRVFIAFLAVVLWSRNRKEQLFIWTAAFTATPVAIQIISDESFRITFSYAVGRCLNQPIYVLDHVSLWFLLVFLLRLNENRRLVRLTDMLARLSLAAGTLDGILAFYWGSATVWMQWADGLLSAFIILVEVFPFVLIYMGLRRKLDASRWAVALSALVLQMIGSIGDGSALGRRFTHWSLFDFLNNPLFTVQGEGFYPDKIASLILFGAILYAVYRYVLEQQARQNVLEREMQSAREIQQVLIPETLPSLEGYAVTSAYQPALEVGGDFFQIIPNPDGSTLVALGDVSGKGLKAAMNVSMIVGVLRAEAGTTSSPAEILIALNRCLAGRMRGGFATGVVLRLDPDGTVTMANAGHIPPYLNGQEYTLEASLPLGLIGAAAYTEMALQLHPGDQLSLCTDGLLEARNSTGELYGFDRLHALLATRPTAQQATEAAIEFGQDDDITVLTITRLAAGEESSTSLTAPLLAGAVKDR
jgi:hypothetical protein